MNLRRAASQVSRAIAAALPFLMLSALPVTAQETLWKTYLDEGVKAYQTGRYAEAEKLLKLAIAEAEQFGPSDPRLATSLNNLAVLYRTQGDYAKAEPLYKRSLAIFEKALGPEHPDVATSLNNLAALYYTQGDYAKAEPLYKRSLAISEKALGPQHPSVATSLENYGLLLQATSRPAEAQKLLDRAAAIRKGQGK